MPNDDVDPARLAGFLLPEQRGEHSRQSPRMTRDTRIALFLIGELVAALRANDSDAFRGLLS